MTVRERARFIRVIDTRGRTQHAAHYHGEDQVEFRVTRDIQVDHIAVLDEFEQRIEVLDMKQANLIGGDTISVNFHPKVGR